MTFDNMATKDAARRAITKAIRNGERTLPDGREAKRRVLWGSTTVEYREDRTQEPKIYPEVRIYDFLNGSWIVIPEKVIYPMGLFPCTPDGGTRSRVRHTARRLVRNTRQAERRLCREARYTGETPEIDEVGDVYVTAHVRVHR